MKYLPVKVSLFLFPGVLFAVGLFLRNPTKFGQCIDSKIQNWFCATPVSEIGWTLTEVSFLFFIVAGLVLISSEIGFKRWLKFSYVAIPVCIGLFFLGRAAFPDGALFYIEPVRIVDFIGYWLYLPLSALIIGFSYLPSKAK